MSLEDLEIRKHANPLRAELDRQKEKCAAAQSALRDAESERDALRVERNLLARDLAAAEADLATERAARDVAFAAATKLELAMGLFVKGGAQGLADELAAVQTLADALQGELAAERERHHETAKRLASVEHEKKTAYGVADVHFRDWQKAEAERDRLRELMDDLVEHEMPSMRVGPVGARWNRARAALAASKESRQLPVDEEAEARFERLFAKKRKETP